MRAENAKKYGCFMHFCLRPLRPVKTDELQTRFSSLVCSHGPHQLLWVLTCSPRNLMLLSRSCDHLDVAFNFPQLSTIDTRQTSFHRRSLLADVLPPKMEVAPPQPPLIPFFLLAHAICKDLGWDFGTPV